MANAVKSARVVTENDKNDREAAMSSHAFDVISKSRTEIEIAHHEEGHHYKFTVTKNGQGKRVLADTTEVVATAGAKHPPEWYSASARAFATTAAHRAHAID